MPFQVRNKLQGTFVNDCRTMTNAAIVEKWVYRATPYAFRTLPEDFQVWRSALGDCLGLDPASIYVVGSSAAGLSLNPGKGLRLHMPKSDVDLAVISPELFRVAWNWFIVQRAERIMFPTPVKDWIDDHRTRLIFYRQIGCNQYLEYLPFGRQWTECLDLASTQPPVSGRSVKTRIYDDKEALTAYLVKSVTDLRTNLGI